MAFFAQSRFSASLVAVAVAFAPCAALADQIPPVFVSAAGEDDNGNSDCRLYHGTAVTTVENALRSNSVSLGSRDDYFADRALAMYISVTAMRGKTKSGEMLSNCAAYLSIEFSTATNLTNPATGGKHWASIQFCNVGTLFNWEVDTIQSRASEELRDLTKQCLDKYRSTIRS